MATFSPERGEPTSSMRQRVHILGPSQIPRQSRTGLGAAMGRKQRKRLHILKALWRWKVQKVGPFEKTGGVRKRDDELWCLREGPLGTGKWAVLSTRFWQVTRCREIMGFNSVLIVMETVMVNPFAVLFFYFWYIIGGLFMGFSTQTWKLSLLCVWVWFWNAVKGTLNSFALIKLHVLGKL